MDISAKTGGIREESGSESEAHGTAPRCGVCFRHCRIPEGRAGACRARVNRGGKIVPANYGVVTALALDPIEKKPLRRFEPGSRILSVGSYGCNLRCPFCQNYEISTAGENSPGLISYAEPAGRNIRLDTRKISPVELVSLADSLRPGGNIGLAFTYNEPLVGWEYVRDAAALSHEKGLKNVMVTNGTASRDVLRQLLPLIDAMNIDLKGFSGDFYRDYLGGDLAMVREFIAEAAEHCHVELTTLIIPGKNDREEEMLAEAEWIASLNRGRGEEIPLHISRYFPRYRETEKATDVPAVYRLAQAARKYLRYVYTGNC
ncbi:MAG: radical SAM protein [Lachnospiraceae bacterium]|jgi:pyruvate formate lyase activating enzyme